MSSFHPLFQIIGYATLSLQIEEIVLRNSINLSINIKIQVPLFYTLSLMPVSGRKTTLVSPQTKIRMTRIALGGLLKSNRTKKSKSQCQFRFCLKLLIPYPCMKFRTISKKKLRLLNLYI